MLELIKNEDGDFFFPEWDFDNIREMRAGEGYKIKVTEDVVIDFGE